MNIRELGALLRTRQTSCRELVNQAISAAEKHKELRAFITITETQALDEAAARDRELQAGHDRGPLHGIPIALKDLFYTRGIRTTAGSLLFRDFIPDTDARVVEKLREAGAINIGKTNLHELAFGITSRNPHFGPVLNPLDHARLTGGSSGGSAAAVAAGIVPLALGTDTGGSIRIPASYCGIVGLKPTYGRVSRRGVLPLAFSLDHVGPLGSCVDDCALAFEAMSEQPLHGAAPTTLQQLRIGIPRTFFFEHLEAAVRERTQHAIGLIKSLGAQVHEVDIANFEEIGLASRVVQLAEFASLHIQQNHPELFGEDVWSLLEQGRSIAGHEYVNAQRLRTLFRREMDALWQEIDVLVTPTTPIVAPPVDIENVTLNGLEETVRMASTRFVRGFNYLGEPALSMPCGKTDGGMPVGLQLISKPYSELTLLELGRELERVLEC